MWNWGKFSTVVRINSWNLLPAIKRYKVAKGVRHELIPQWYCEITITHEKIPLRNYR